MSHSNFVFTVKAIDQESKAPAFNSFKTWLIDAFKLMLLVAVTERIGGGP